MHVYFVVTRDAMEMGSAVGPGVEKLDDDAAPSRDKARRWWSRTGPVLVVCLMTLPFLAFFFGGMEGASTVWRSTAGAKLNSVSRGFLDTSSNARRKESKVVDELLGGLLTPGFDRRSCLSRYQAAHYYKYSPYNPSSYLLRKLREYEARHKKCAPGTPLYAKAIEQLRSGHATETMECNYIVWLPYNGLGNLMMSLISTFVYALLTGRVVLVYSPGDFTDLFCEPFPDTTWILPPDFPLTNLSRLGLNPPQSYRNLLNRKMIVNDSTKATVESLPPYVFLNLGHEKPYMDRLFYCQDDQLVLSKVSWLLVFSDLYFVPAMYPMAQYHDDLQRLFPDKESVSHLIARYLLHPSNSVWGLVTRYHSSYLAQAKQRIGVQIRMFRFATIPVDDMYNQILNCSRQEHILPEIEVDDEELQAGIGNATASGGAAEAGDSKAILIASLYGEYYERIRSMYYEHAAKGGVRVSVFQPSHEEVQATGKLGHDVRALAEIYLLSFCDVLLTSGDSTFGSISSSLAGLRPTILLVAYGYKVPKTPCVRAVSMEPCDLAPPRVRCKGYPVDKDKEDVARHVKACEDDRGGIKLFD